MHNYLDMQKAACAENKWGIGGGVKGRCVSGTGFLCALCEASPLQLHPQTSQEFVLPRFRLCISSSFSEPLVSGGHHLHLPAPGTQGP